MLFGDDDGPQGQIDLDVAHGVVAVRGEEVVGRLAGGLEPLLQRGALVRQAVRQVLDPSLHFAVDKASGTSSTTRSASACGSAGAQRHLRVGLADVGDARDEIGLEFVDGVELRHLARPIVGDLGKDLFLHGLHEHAEVDLALVAGHLGLKVTMSPAFAPPIASSSPSTSVPLPTS